METKVLEMREALAMAVGQLAHVAQTVHQGHHRDRPGSWRECPVGICVSTANVLRQLEARLTLRCQCQWEAGDSPCPVHGMDEELEGVGA